MTLLAPMGDGELLRLQNMMAELVKHAVRPVVQSGGRVWELAPTVSYMRMDGKTVKLGLRCVQTGSSTATELLVDHLVVEPAFRIADGKLVYSFGEPLGYGSAQTYDLLSAAQAMLLAIRRHSDGESERLASARKQKKLTRRATWRRRLSRACRFLGTPVRWAKHNADEAIAAVAIISIASIACVVFYGLVTYSPTTNFDNARYSLDGGTVSRDGETVHAAFSQQLYDSKALATGIPSSKLTVASGLREVTLSGFKKPSGRCSALAIDGDVPEDTQLVSWTDVRAGGVTDPTQDFTIRFQRSTREVVVCFTGNPDLYEQLDTTRQSYPRVVFDLVSTSRPNYSS